MTLKDGLNSAIDKLKKCSDSPILDAELLLAHILKKSRSWLYTYPQQVLTQTQITAFAELIQQRIQGKPIAYILKQQGFWDLELMVNEAVLIPRPETECLVEVLLESLPQTKPIKILDLGTGSGAIALALGKSRPSFCLWATDNSAKALAVAKDNRDKHQINNVKFFKSDWYDGLPEQQFHAIVSNPPYIGRGDLYLAANVFAFEPHEALFAEHKGFADLQKIISGAKVRLLKDGLLALEHGFKQGESVRAALQKAGAKHIKTHQDYAKLERFTIAYFN